MYNMLCYLCTRLLMLPHDTFLGTLFPLGINLLLQDILQLDATLRLHYIKNTTAENFMQLVPIPSLESSVLYFIISIPIWSITLQIITESNYEMLIFYCSELYSEPIVCKIYSKPKNCWCTACRNTTS